MSISRALKTVARAVTTTAAVAAVAAGTVGAAAGTASAAADATTSASTSAATVHLSTRAGSLAFFRSDYTPSPAAGWTGITAGCVAGTTTQAYKDSVAKRINYFRAMAGVPASTTIDPTTSAKAQQAALMMAAKGQLSHTPDASWRCSTGDGVQAAGKSNLSIGSSGADVINSYVMDNGPGNTSTGHRRWVLYPQTQKFGTGDIPSGTQTNALWVMDANAGSPRPATRSGYVAWPPAGYVPID